jgi:hypothetical protein
MLIKELYYFNMLNIIEATSLLAKVISADIVFILAIIAYTFTIFRYFTLAKGTNSRGNTLQQDTKRR